MIKFCTNCGTANTPDARYCAKCGTAMPLPAGETVSEDPLSADTAAEPLIEEIFSTRPVSPSEPMVSPGAKRGSPWPIIAAIAGGLLLIGGLYYWLFLADDMGGSSPASYSAGPDEGPTAEAKQFYVMTEANIRDKPTTRSSSILGKMPRGSAVTGTVKLGEDGISEWLELADGKGFIGLVNLGEAAPPEISKTLSDKVWTTDGPFEIWAQADTASNLVERVGEGTKLTLTGLTANDFIEVKLRKGGVGYLAGGAGILSRLGGKPVAIAFNPQTCNFGGEISAEFAKLGARLKAQWQALEDKEFADDEAREAAYNAAEGKTVFVKLPRSFEGLTLTAIAQHYESQSLYFSDPPAKVVDVFRAKGFRIGNDGTFPSTDLYAGINATRGESAAYGKSELGCGV